MLEDPDFNLEKVISMYKAAEIIQTRMKSLETKPDAETVDRIINPH